MNAEDKPGSQADAAPEPGQTVRRLVRAAGQATLATALARDNSGRPYASLVLSAADHDGSPVLLISDLADHTKNLKQDPRAALLFDGTAGYQDPLTGPRAGLQGELHPVEDGHRAAHLKRRFVARHPGAQVYVEFRDFRAYRLAVDSAHLVAGFGDIHWIERDQVLFDDRACAALADAEQDILAHMNQDHGEALALIAERLLGLPRAEPDNQWIMTGIDPEGVDLRAGRRLARAEFEATVHDAGSARVALVALTRRARAVP